MLIFNNTNLIKLTNKLNYVLLNKSNLNLLAVLFKINIKCNFIKLFSGQQKDEYYQYS